MPDDPDDLLPRRAITSISGLPWPKLPDEHSRDVVTQNGETSCGAACGVMLLADRGIHLDQAALSGVMRLPTPADDLAQCLTTLSGTQWAAGSVDLPGAVPWGLIQALTLRGGSWGALLQPLPLGKIGHWVVIDGITDHAVVLIRDPAGESYGMPLSDFAALWRYTVLVVEERKP
jgi:filamentous hemagglutinin